MKQFDVLINPVARVRAQRPYVIILQHERASFEEDVVVAPLSVHFLQPTLLSPVLPVLGMKLQLVTRNISFFPASRLRGDVVENLATHSNAITRALDQLFNAAG